MAQFDPVQYGSMDRRLGFDPNLLSQMQYMMGAGVNPMMPQATSIADIFGETLPSTEPGDEFDITDRNKQFTGAKSMLSMMSDPAFHAWFAPQFGGGYGPEAFEPIVNYEPIEMPGRRLLTRMQGMGQDSLDRFVADEILNGATGQEVIDGLIAAYNDPEAEGHELALKLMPKTGSIDRTGGRGGEPGQAYVEPDFGQLATKVNSAWNAYLSDPEGEYDEAGELIIDPRTGLPARRLEEKSEATKYFEKIGLPNPYATYDPDEFISEDRRAAEEASLANYLLRVQGLPEGLEPGGPPVLSGTEDLARLRQQLGGVEQLLAQDRATYKQYLGDLDAYGREQQSRSRAEAERPEVTFPLRGSSPQGRVPIGEKIVDVPMRGQVRYPVYEEVPPTVGRENGGFVTPLNRGGDGGGGAAAGARGKRPTTTVTPKQIENRLRAAREAQKQYDRRKWDIIGATGARQGTMDARALRTQQMKDLQAAGYSPYQDKVRAVNLAMQHLFMAPPAV